MKNFPTILYILVLILLIPSSLKGEKKDFNSYHYITDDSNRFSPYEVLEMLHKNHLQLSSSTLNLSFKNKTAWIVIKLAHSEEEQFLTIQNAHLDLIDLYYYSNDNLLSIQKSGDHLNFDTRDLNNNFFNFKVPQNATFIVMKVSSEGPIFVPITLANGKHTYHFLTNYGILHWMFFGFIFLILLSNILLYIWMRESIYLYYILFLIGLVLMTGVDYGYTFQYLWPNHPEINKYNTLFYLSSIATIIFSEKLFDVKKNFPGVHILFKILYLLFAIIAICNMVLSYRTSIQLYSYTVLAFNLIYLCIAIYFYKKIRNLVAKFYLTGWVIFIVGSLTYTVFILTSTNFSILLNNLTQISSAVQIIFLNLAILSNINVLKKEKEKILIDHNETLEKHIKTQDELIGEILDKEKTITQERIRTSTILDTTKGLIMMLNKHGRIVAFNKACENTTGYTFEEVQGNYFWDILTIKEEVGGAKHIFGKIRESKTKVLQYENYLITKDGRKRWIVWDTSTTYNDNGELEYILGTGIDITDKKEIEKAIQKSEITLQSILNSIDQSIWILDKDMNLISYNQKFKSNVNKILKLDVYPGKKFGTELSKDETEFWIPLLKKSLEGEQINFRKTFETRIFDYTLFPIIVEKEINGVLIVSTEITEKIRQQEYLEQSEEKYRTLTETSPAAIVLYDMEENKIIETNAQASALFKWSREEFLHLTPMLLSPPVQENGSSSEELIKHNLDKAMNGETVIFEWLHIDKNGLLIPTQVWLNKLTYKEKIYIRATIIDITERKEHQDSLNAFIKFQDELINRIKEQEASLSALINSTSDLIFSIDLNFNLTEYNEAFKTSIQKNHNVEFKKGINFKQFIRPEFIEVSEKNFAKAFDGNTVNATMEFKNNIGETQYRNFTYSPIFSTKQEIIGVTVISRDITESKKAEGQLIEINKQVSEYKLMALRSAMNPHFLFNSLNSIQYFVAKNERKLALDYLSVFAVLIRKILDSSVSNTVSLTTELEILKHYISLEKLRFDNKFDYEINIDPSLEVDDIKIPSLLIQPFVENSIIHGLTNKEGRGLLQIDISEKDSYLLISVRDNGIGRKQAESQREISKNKSYGMLLTQERLDIVNKTANVSVSIEDLSNQEGVPTGTKIDILIKI